MVEKTFFVNLNAESSEALSYKINLIVKELTSRTTKNKITENSKYNHAIDKPIKRALTKIEIEKKIQNWAKNKNLKVSKCLTIMKKYKWSLTVKQWKKMMSDSILINNSGLFLVSLSKKPYERKWINSKGEQKRASDYGNILVINDNYVRLNKDYETLIKKHWW